MVSVSSDGGVSFGAPEQLSPAGNNGTGNGRQGSSIDVGPTGPSTWRSNRASPRWSRVSTDGGKKWSRPVTIGPVVDIHDPIPGANFRTARFPTIAADPRVGSTTVYTSWADPHHPGGAGSSSPRRPIAVRAPGALPQRCRSPASEGYTFFQGLDVAPNGRVDRRLPGRSVTRSTRHTFGTGNAGDRLVAAVEPVNGHLVDPGQGLDRLVRPVRQRPEQPAASVLGRLQHARLPNNTASFIATDARRAPAALTSMPTRSTCRTTVWSSAATWRDRLSQRRPASIRPCRPVGQARAFVACPSKFGNTDAVARFTP